MSQFGMPNQQLANTEYELFGISHHMGGADGGHYIADVRRKEQWYECNDTKVSTTKGPKINSASPYVMFYRRTTEPLEKTEDDHPHDEQESIWKQFYHGDIFSKEHFLLLQLNLNIFPHQ